MSCGVGHRRGSDPTLLWLWCRLAATAPIQPLAWETPYAVGVVLEKAKKKTPKKKNHLGIWLTERRGRAAWRTCWLGLQGVGVGFHKPLTEKKKLSWVGKRMAPRPTPHSLRHVLLFIAYSSIFQHWELPSSRQETKGTPDLSPRFRGAGVLLSTVLDQPLWGHRPKPLALLSREGRSPWQGPARPDGGLSACLSF